MLTTKTISNSSRRTRWLCLAIMALFVGLVASASGQKGALAAAKPTTFPPSGGQNITQFVKNLNFTISDSRISGENLDINKGNNLADYANDLPTGTYKPEISFDIELPAGQRFKNNMYIELPITYPSDYVDSSGVRYPETTFIPTSWEILTDASGKRIGWWCDKAGGGNYGVAIQIVLDNVEGASQISTIKLSQNYNVVRKAQYGQDRLYTIAIDGKTFTYKILKRSLVAYTEQFAKAQNNAMTNDRIQWKVYLGQKLVSELAVSDGRSATSTNDVLIEDRISSKTSPTYEFCYNLPAPINLRNGHTNKINSAEGEYSFTIRGEAVLSTITEIQQNSGESYAEFLNRVKASPMQYGAYNYGDTDGDGLNEYGVVIYYGRMGIDTPVLADIAPNFAQDAANWLVQHQFNNGESEETVVNWYNQVYGRDNVLGGRAYQMSARFTSYYDTVTEYTEVPNKADVTLNGVLSDSPNWQAVGKLEPVSGSATPGYDEDDPGEIIPEEEAGEEVKQVESVDLTPPNTGTKSVAGLALPILMIISGLSLFGWLVVKRN